MLAERGMWLGGERAELGFRRFVGLIEEWQVGELGVESFAGEGGAVDAGFDFGEGCLAGGGRSEPAIVGGAEAVERDIACGFEDAVAHFFGGYR